jgi:hypothetical protein
MGADGEMHPTPLIMAGEQANHKGRQHFNNPRAAPVAFADQASTSSEGMLSLE